MPEDEVQYDEELSERQVLDVHLAAQAQARVHHSLYHQLTEHRKDNMVEVHRWRAYPTPVFRIRIHRIHMFLGLPDPDPFVRGMDPDPDPSLIM
jgi:hypothetical protein